MYDKNPVIVVTEFRERSGYKLLRRLGVSTPGKCE